MDRRLISEIAEDCRCREEIFKMKKVGKRWKERVDAREEAVDRRQSWKIEGLP